MVIPTPAAVEFDVSSIMGLERREADMETSDRYLFILVIGTCRIQRDQLIHCYHITQY